MSSDIFLRAVDKLCKHKLDPSFVPAPQPARPAAAEEGASGGADAAAAAGAAAGGGGGPEESSERRVAGRGHAHGGARESRVRQHTARRRDGGGGAEAGAASVDAELGMPPIRKRMGKKKWQAAMAKYNARKKELGVVKKGCFAPSYYDRHSSIIL